VAWIGDAFVDLFLAVVPCVTIYTRALIICQLVCACPAVLARVWITLIDLSVAVFTSIPVQTLAEVVTETIVYASGTITAGGITLAGV
jgi:hypothetical protein